MTRSVPKNQGRSPFFLFPFCTYILSQHEWQQQDTEQEHVEKMKMKKTRRMMTRRGRKKRKQKRKTKHLLIWRIPLLKNTFVFLICGFPRTQTAQSTHRQWVLAHLLILRVQPNSDQPSQCRRVAVHQPQGRVQRKSTG